MSTTIEAGIVGRELRQMSRECRAMTNELQHAQRIEQAEAQFNRVTSRVNQLVCKLERQLLYEQDPGDPRLKRRLPQVMKNLSPPGWGADFMRRAVAVGDDPDALRRLCEAERAAGRMEF